MKFLSTILFQYNLLFESYYNRLHPLTAIYRLIYWNIFKTIKHDFYYKLWGYKFKFYINSHQSYWLFKNYLMDYDEFTLIKRIVKPGDIIFDIGANIGVYSFWFSKCINDNGRIFSFEPDDENFRRLNFAISLNKLKSVLPQTLALSDFTGESKFSIGLDEQNALINGRYSENNKFKIVQTTTIDRFCELHSIVKIDFMKIDVEGAEWFVLNGAVQMLKKNKIKIIQLEINEQLLKYEVDVKKLIYFMRDFGYKIYSLKGNLVEVDINNENILKENKNNYFFIADIDLYKNVI